MRLATLTLALLCCAVGIANAAEPSQQQPIYTLELWVPMGPGLAIARTVGPMTSAECPQALVPLRTAPPRQVPPSLQRREILCVTQWEMQSELGVYHCAAALRSALGRRYPNVSIWLYSCAVL